MSLLAYLQNPFTGILKDDSAVRPDAVYKHIEVNRWDSIGAHLWTKSGFLGALDSGPSFNPCYSDEDRWEWPEIDNPKYGGRQNVVYRIQGITEDSNGSPLGNCVVKLFRAADDSKQDQCTSDAAGNYILWTPFTDAHYCVMFLDPSLAGATIRTLTPV
jgi:hypothetical protein